MVQPSRRFVFITGATGYMGRSLIPVLLARGHCVRALARESSERRVPPGAEVVPASLTIATVGLVWAIERLVA